MASVVVWGVGQLGGVFARGLLRAGYSVVPVTRHTDPFQVAQSLPRPEQVLVAVGEDSLDGVLERVPPQYAERLGFVQNEVLPGNWRRFGIATATMIVVWFEKKSGRDVHVLQPSQVYGPGAELYAKALAQLDISCSVLRDEAQLLREMVLKNVYILVINSAGLEVGGTTGNLWNQHRDLALATARDVIELQQAMSGESLDETYLLDRLQQALLADPDHGCTGRTAPARLRRALVRARELGVAIPTLQRLARVASLDAPPPQVP